MTNNKILFGIALYSVVALMIQSTCTSADWNSGDALIREYNVAAGKIPKSPDVLNFNLALLNSPGLFFYNIEAGKKYCIINQSNESIFISRLLIDNESFFLDYYTEFAKNRSKYVKKTDGTLVLPEGFAITVLEGVPSNTYARFSITRNGEEIDNKSLKTGDVYEYRMDLDGNGQSDNPVLSFIVGGISLSTAIDDQPLSYSVPLISVRLISLDTAKFNLASAASLDQMIYDNYKERGDENLNFSVNYAKKIPVDSFIYKTSMYRSEDGETDIAWLGRPYHVIDHNAMTVNLSRWLADSYKRTLVDGETLVLPERFSITVLGTDQKTTPRSASFSLMKDGEEIDNMVMRVGDAYEYKMDLNRSGRRDNWVMRFNLDEVFAGSTVDLVQLKTLQLISPEVLSINNGSTIYFTSEGYRTDITNNGKTIKVVPRGDISLIDGGTTFFMDNWFGVKVQSDAAAVSSAAMKADTSGLTGAFEYLVFDSTDFNLTSMENPAILFFDMDAGQGFEKLDFSIEQMCPGCNSYNIPGHSLKYSTEIYHAGDNNDPEIAWLGQHYSVIENTTSRFLISRFLIDENEETYHLLGAGDSLQLKDGFYLKLVDINTFSATAEFSLVKDNAESHNSALKAGDTYQYKKDLKGNGKEEDWLIRFKIESIDTGTGKVRINGLQMISPQVLELNNGETMESYRIDIGKDASMLEVRMNDRDNDILLKEDDITGIIDNKFHIRVYKNGNAVALVFDEKGKGQGESVPRRNSRERGELKATGPVNISATEIPNNTEKPVLTSPGPVKDASHPGLLESVFVLMIVLYVKRKKR
ncbi:S-layer protein [uncultured archaeon]|nr:S-layer protein [uncultured archaeon]